MQGDRPAGAGRILAAAAAIFVVAILMARLLLSRGDLWILFVLALPVLLVVLSLAFGFLRAVALVAFFASAVLAFRWILTSEVVGWVVVLLAPALLLSAYIAVRVARALWPRQGGKDGTNGGGREEGPEGVSREGP